MNPPTLDAERLRRLREQARAGISAARRAFSMVPVTGLGWTVVLLAAGSWYLAIRFGWSEFELVATTLLVLLALGLVFLVRRGTYDIALSLSPERISVGGDAFGAVTIRNRGGLRSLPQRIDIPVGDGVITFDTPSIEAGGTYEQPFEVPTDRRQVVTIGPVTLVRGDPIGFYRREKASAPAQRVWVHPRTARVGSSNQGWTQDMDAPTSDNNPQGDVAFHTIREYAPGDDLRHIHWRTTARMDKFMVRHYVDNRRPKFALVIDLNRGSYASGDEFETAMSAAASVERRSFELGCPVVHHLGRRRVDTPRVAGLLDSLSEARPVPGRGSLVDGIRGVLGRDADATVAIVLTGSVADPDIVLRNSQRLGSRMRTATIVANEQRSGASEQGRSLRLEVTSLDDFAKRWRAAGIQ